MFVLKGFEIKRGRRFGLSNKLLAADEKVIPKAAFVYNFITGSGEKTLLGHVSKIPLIVGKGVTKISGIIEEKSKALKDSSRGKYSLKNGRTPRSDFLKTMIEYKNGEKSKDEEEQTDSLK